MPIALSSAKELLAKLVSFDTESSKSNLELIEFLRHYLEGFGLSCTLVPTDDGAKAGLLATIGDASASGGIGLSGHTDVVPVEGQSWHSDPFSLREVDGQLFGRGTSDMKGYLACMLALVPVACERRLARPIHLIFSYDEEIGCLGVLPLIEKMGRDFARPDVVFVGEPTEMTVVEAHKSIQSFDTVATGKEAHSSIPDQGANAIFMASAYVTELVRISRDGAFVGSDERFDPPRSTIHVGRIKGGVAHNIVPKSCWFKWEVRGLPRVDAETILQHMNRFVDQEILPSLGGGAAEASVVTTKHHHVPGFASAAGSAAVSLALRLAEQNETFAVSYGTEAGHFENAGIPTVICGPGSIAQAHQPNEFIQEDELAKCLSFMERLVDYASRDDQA